MEPFEIYEELEMFVEEWISHPEIYEKRWVRFMAKEGLEFLSR